MINSKPGGLLSLLGLKSGLDSPQALGEVLGLTIDALRFYIANVLQIDTSGTALGASLNNNLVYPGTMPAVPTGSIRYVESASLHLQYTSGAAFSCSGWICTRQSGVTYPFISETLGVLTSSSSFAVPYSSLRDFILQPGDQLGAVFSSGALSVGQVNWGIRYADFVL